MAESEVVAYAASIEQYSEHPIAQGIVRDAKEKWDVDDFQAIPGKGAEGKVKGKNVKTVSPGYLREKNIKADDSRIEELGKQGKTVIFVLIEDELKGAIALADIILVKSNPNDVAAILGLAKATYSKMIQNLIWATGYNAFAIPAAAGVLAPFGIVLGPALGAVFMSASTVICAVNSKLLRLK